MVTLREANVCSCAVIYQQLGICRGARGRDNDISFLYACTFVRAKFSAMGCPQVVAGCVDNFVFSVGKCYTTASIELEKNRKKRSTERGCQTLATLLLVPCEQAR